MKKLILLAAITFLSSCSTYIPVDLPLPPKLDLPTVSEGGLNCISDEDYEVLVLRDKLQSARIDTLTNIIKSTRGE